MSRRGRDLSPFRNIHSKLGLEVDQSLFVLVSEAPVNLEILDFHSQRQNNAVTSMKYVHHALPRLLKINMSGRRRILIDPDVFLARSC